MTLSLLGQRRRSLERLLEVARAEGLLQNRGGAGPEAPPGPAQAIPAERAPAGTGLAERGGEEPEWSRLRAEVEERSEEQVWLLEILDGVEAFWQAEREEARLAHDRLLAHHRHVVSFLRDELESLVRAIPFWRPRERRRARALLDLMRKELG
jgi:hypothetical protein